MTTETMDCLHVVASGRGIAIKRDAAFEQGFRAGRAAGLVASIAALEQALGDPCAPATGLDESGLLRTTGHGRRRGRPCLLLVDDEPINLDLLTDTLEGDCEVLAAQSGPDALALAAAQLPDLILLDVMMPGMSGYEVCRRLKLDARTRAIPVIFVTRLGDAVAETTGLEMGAVDYIAKPIHPGAVLARVHHQIKLRLAQEKLVRLSAMEKTLRSNLMEALEDRLTS